MKVLLSFLFFSLICFSQSWENTIIISDLEGRSDCFDELIKDGHLAVENGKLKFANPETKLVFLGDHSDRANKAFYIREQLSHLKELNPDNVTIILGNRDLNKLTLFNDLQSLKTLKNIKYREHLFRLISKNSVQSSVITLTADFENLHIDDFKSKYASSLKQYHNKFNQVDWWFKDRSLVSALENHHSELKSLGKNLNYKEAVLDYYKRISPGGEYFEFLKKGQVLDYDELTGSFFNHSGITKENWMYLPDGTKFQGSVKEYVKNYNKQFSSMLGELEFNISNYPNMKSRSKLYSIIDASMDPDGNLKVNGKSYAYGKKFKLDGVYMLPDEKFLKELSAKGIINEFVGHSPQPGQTPLIDRKNNFSRFYCDTSYVKGGERSYTLLNKNSQVTLVNEILDRPKLYTIINQSDPYIGRILKNISSGEKFIVRGINSSNEYIITRYTKSYGIDQLKVSSVEIEDFFKFKTLNFEKNYRKTNALDTLFPYYKGHKFYCTSVFGL